MSARQIGDEILEEVLANTFGVHPLAKTDYHDARKMCEDLCGLGITEPFSPGKFGYRLSAGSIVLVVGRAMRSEGEALDSEMGIMNLSKEFNGRLGGITCVLLGSFGLARFNETKGAWFSTREFDEFLKRGNVA